MKKQVTYIAGIAIVFIVMLVMITNHKDASMTPITEVKIDKDYNVQETLSGMVNEADYIVKGHFETLEFEEYNMLRNKDNPDLPDTEEYIGRIYQFHVDETLYGDTSPVMNYLLPYEEHKKIVEDNAVIDESGIIVKPATVSNEYIINIKDPLFIEPQCNVSYIIPLTKTLHDNYINASEPGRMRITDDGTLELESNLIEGNTDSFEQVFQVSENHDPLTVHLNYGGFIQDQVSGTSLQELRELIDTIKE